MSVKLNTIPASSLRPSPPKPLRWFGALLGFITAGILLIRFLGKLVDETTFWWFAMGIPIVFWTVLMGLRLAVYMMQQIQANAWDQRREQVILQEVRRGRRALQILAAECSTAHAADMRFTIIADALLRNENKIIPQTSWNDGRSIRHSRLPVTHAESPDMQVLAAFSNLLKKLSGPLSCLPPDNPISVLLESSSSLSESRIRELWQRAWQGSALPQPILFTQGQGLAVIDRWLDHRIKDHAVLLVVSLQIAPEQPEMTGEAIVGLLLGNRLTQHSLPAMALLHRPECCEPQQASLQAGVLQAADWVPLLPNEVQHLWLAGLPVESEAYLSVITVQDKPPLCGIAAGSNVHNFDQFLGDPGCAGPWLAIAAAAQAISQQPAPHMIISGEQDSDTVWSTVVAPIASHKENTA